MLLLLLIVPVLIAVVGFLTDRERITFKEFLVHMGVVTLVIGIGYAIALSSRSDDTELWNGVVAKKWEGTEHCCHSYPCNCHESCSGSGRDRSCSTVCDTCYLHFEDDYWAAESSNGERVFTDGCNAPGGDAPARWNAIKIGEPTAVEHSFTNYLLGNPDSILRREGAEAKYLDKIPKYPYVYDHYRANRFIGGYLVGDDQHANERLSEINATLGAPKQVNIVVIASTLDAGFAEAMNEAWLGGKKNDVVVLVGVSPNTPKATWAKVVSWSKAEDMKLAIRDGILDLPKVTADTILDVISKQVETKFVRRDWHDFDYLKSTVEPSSGSQTFLLILGIVLSIGAKIVMSQNDLFGDEGYRPFGYRSRRRF